MMMAVVIFHCLRCGGAFLTSMRTSLYVSCDTCSVGGETVLMIAGPAVWHCSGYKLVVEAS